MRVTHGTIQQSTLANLQRSLARMGALQQQQSSGVRVSSPSDDPAAAAEILRLQASGAAVDRYARNASDGQGWLATVDGALAGALAQLRSGRDLAVSGGNAGLTASAREALAVEVEQVRDALLDAANTRHLGRTVFAGTSDAGAAFDEGYAWTGSAGATVQRRVSETATVRVDADGAAAFGTGTGSVFAVLDRLAAALRAGTGTGDAIAEIDDRLSAMLAETAAVGARANRLDAAADELAGAGLDITARLSAVRDVDLAEVVMELQLQEVAYRGALSAAAKTLQPSLLDFLS